MVLTTQPVFLLQVTWRLPTSEGKATAILRFAVLPS